MYEAPSITELGSIEELTAGSSGYNLIDNGQFDFGAIFGRGGTFNPRPGVS